MKEETSVLLQFLSGFPLVVGGKKKLTSHIKDLNVTSYITEFIHLVQHLSFDQIVSYLVSDLSIQKEMYQKRDG